MPFLPRENTSQAFMSAAVRGIFGGKREGKGSVGEGEKIHRQLGPKGFDLNGSRTKFLKI